MYRILACPKWVLNEKYVLAADKNGVFRSLSFV